MVELCHIVTIHITIIKFITKIFSITSNHSVTLHA